MKRTIALFALAFGLLLTGCAQPQQESMDLIGSEQAKTAALQDAGLEAGGVTFTDVTLDRRSGVDYYDVEFSTREQSYEYDIDALTGVVIESKVESLAASPTAASDTASKINPDTATQNVGPQAAAASISAEEAKRKALAHAGLTADAVSFVKAELDRDDGRQVYDVEFYTDEPKEYDYEIDALTGEVISYDHDADAYTPPVNKDSSISADKAKAIALAQVPGAAAGDIREFETDYDDGRLAYEGKIVYDGREYEFEIDGYSGAIRSWEAESVGD